MTKEERWKLEGNGRDTLHEAKRNVAALRIDIELHVQNLNEAAHYLTHFLSDPLGAQHTIDEAVRLLITDELRKKADRLVTESRKVEALEKRIRECD
jgi:hypothetical protein